MPSSHDGRKCGLERATAKDGTVEWVLPEDIERFESQGEALLGKDSKPSDDEKHAHEEARTQIEARQEQVRRRAKEMATIDAPADAAAMTEEPRTGWPELVDVRTELQTMQSNLLEALSAQKVQSDTQNKALLEQIHAPPASCACVIS